MNILKANRIAPDGAPHFTASHLGPIKGRQYVNTHMQYNFYGPVKIDFCIFRRKKCDVFFLFFFFYHFCSKHEPLYTVDTKFALFSSGGFTWVSRYLFLSYFIYLFIYLFADVDKWGHIN